MKTFTAAEVAAILVGAFERNAPEYNRAVTYIAHQFAQELEAEGEDHEDFLRETGVEG